MEIEIQEENNQKILSKTQKQKIRRLVKNVWKDEMDFYDHIDDILQQVHYDPIHKDQPYNHIEHNMPNDKHLVLLFKKIHIETPEERQKMLRQKLRNAIKNKKHAQSYVDVKEQTYQRLCQQIPVEQRRIIPSPAQVQANLEIHRQMLTMLPSNNPLHQYLSMFF